MATIDRLDIGLDTSELVAGAKFFIGLSSRNYTNNGTDGVSTNVSRECEDTYTGNSGTWATDTSQYVGNNTFLKNTSATAGDEITYTVSVPDDGEWYIAYRIRADVASDIDVVIDGNTDSAISSPTGTWQSKSTYLISGPYTLTAGTTSVTFTVNTNTIVEFDRFTLLPYRMTTGGAVDESWFPREISHEALKLLTRRGVLINV